MGQEEQQPATWRMRLSSHARPYLVYSNGPHKGKYVHRVTVEIALGRRLHRWEVVHHSDGDKLNNDHSNLTVMTLAEHARLHGRQIVRPRDRVGRYAHATAA